MKFMYCFMLFVLSANAAEWHTMGEIPITEDHYDMLGRIDGEGYPTLMYRSMSTTYNFRFARFVNGEWTNLDVPFEHDGYQIEDFDYLFDENGLIHMVYSLKHFNNDYVRLCYAFEESSGDWNITERYIDQTFSATVAFAFDSEENVHFYFPTNSGHRYESYDGTSWTTRLIVPQILFRWGISLCFDQDDRPHLYHISHNEDLYHSWFDNPSGSGEFHTELIDQDVIDLIWRHSYSCIDGNGYPHVLFRRKNHLTHYWKPDSTWHSERMDVNHWTANEAMLRTDPAGEVHAIYLVYDEDHSLYHSILKPDGWQKEVIDTAIMQRFISGDLDQYGNPMAFYQTNPSWGDPLSWAWYGDELGTHEAVSTQSEHLSIRILEQPVGRTATIEININDGAPQTATWELYSIRGRQLDSGYCTLTGPTTQLVRNVSSMQPGMYFLRVSIGSMTRTATLAVIH